MADSSPHGGPAGKQSSDDVPSSFGPAQAAATGSSGSSEVAAKGGPVAVVGAASYLASLTNDLQRLTSRSGSSSRGAVVIDDDDDDDDDVVVVDARTASTGRDQRKVRVGDEAGAAIIECWSGVALTFQCKHCTLINERRAGKFGREFWTCHVCGKPRWELGEDEDRDDPDYAPDDIEGDDTEDDDDIEDEEVQREVAALNMEQYMSIEGVLERQNIPIDEVLALYGKEELTDELDDVDSSDQEDGGEGESSMPNQLIPYYPSLKYAVPQTIERYVQCRTASCSPLR